MHVIGEDSSQRLDVIPAQHQVVVTRRPKYACRACEGTVVQAAAPAHLIEGGLPTERLVAQVLVAKYADHCRFIVYVDVNINDKMLRTGLCCGGTGSPYGQRPFGLLRNIIFRSASVS